ncbi:hypothetical protein DL93DRAFT_2028333, partial [Clavulina sp. PMI_390]
ETYRHVVGSLISLRRPLGVRPFANLLGMTEQDARAILRPLSAVVMVPTDAKAPIHLYHASFQEFLLRATTVETTEVHGLLFLSPSHGALGGACVAHMNSALRQNICDVPADIPLDELASFLPNPSARIQTETQYACLEFAHHLSVAPETILSAQSAVEAWMKRNFFFWLEVLSLLGEVNRV